MRLPVFTCHQVVINTSQFDFRENNEACVYLLPIQKLDSAIQWINLYPVDSAIGFPNTYPLDSDLSGG